MGHQIALGPVYIGFTPLRVCDRRRIHQHRVFKDIAQRGYCSLGLPYGFKLHTITNDTGGIIDLMVTKGNVDDRKPLRCEHFIAKLYGNPFGDAGYIPKNPLPDSFPMGYT